jgi:C1A family cysteine protease
MDMSVTNDVDWRSSGAVTSVKNQQQCGSCWAFSTAGSVESFGKIHGQSLIDLSPQELVDCDNGDSGCNGGLPSSALSYVRSAGGLNSWSDYSYTASKGSCKKKTTHYDKISGTRSCTGESGIASCITSGPVVVAIEADKASFQSYGGGVYDSADCGTSIDHAVLVVGSITYQNKPVWVIKNSWGSSWGSGGYIYMIRGKNMCGISNGYSVQPN